MNVASSLKLTTLFNPQCMILRVILKYGLLDQISLDVMDAIFSYVSITKKQTYLNLIHGTSLEIIRIKNYTHLTKDQIAIHAHNIISNLELCTLFLVP